MENKKRISDGLNQAADAAKAAAGKAKEQVQEELREIEDFTPPRTKRINTAWMWILLVIVCALVIVWIMPAQCTREDGREKGETIAAVLEQGDTVGAPHTMTAAEASEAEAAENAVDARETADGAVAGAAPVDPAAAAALAAPAENAQKADVASADADELARRVLKGEFGDNPDRRAALGDRYAEVQARVNALLK